MTTNRRAIRRIRFVAALVFELSLVLGVVTFFAGPSEGYTPFSLLLLFSILSKVTVGASLVVLLGTLAFGQRALRPTTQRG
jgi:hypothetical protein